MNLETNALLDVIPPYNVIICVCMNVTLTSLIGTEPDLQNSQRGSIITFPTSLPESVSLDGCHIKTLLLTIQICLSGTNLLVLSYTYNVNKGKPCQ